MTNEKKITKLVSEIKDQCNNYLLFVDDVNECAYSDGIIETILKKAAELKELYENQFK